MKAFIVLLSLAVALVASAVIPDGGRANQDLERTRSRRSVGWEDLHHQAEEHVKEVHVTKTVHVPYPVEKKVPVIVEKKVPVVVEKKVPVYIKEKPKPIKIKIKRTKHSHSG